MLKYKIPQIVTLTRNLENYEAAVKADLNGDDSREQRVWWNRR